MLPPDKAGELRLYLHADQLLREDQVTETAADRLDYHLVGGWASGEFSAGGLPDFGLPLDQRLDDSTSLIYSGPPLSEPQEILGRPVVVLYVESSAPVLQYSVRLCDLAADGTVALVSRGNLNATRRTSLTAPEPMETGVVYRLEISLNATAWRFEPGHRIRLMISNTEFPRLWPTPEPAVGFVHRGGDRASCLIVPTIEAGDPASEQVAFGEPTRPSRPAARETFRDAHQDVTYHVLDDAVEARSGFVRTARLADGSEFADTRKLSTRASNSDPALVHAAGETEIELRRDGWTVLARARSDVISNRETFNVSQTLTVFFNGELRHERRWTESIPRVLL